MKNLLKRFSFSRHFRTVSLALFVLGIFVFTGCKAPDVSRPETNTPLGCKKEEGRYFDPVTGVCVTVTSTEQAYSLNNYRYVNKLEAEGVGEVQFGVDFAKNLTEQEYISLMKDLPGVKVQSFAMYFFEQTINTGGDATGLEVNDELVKKAFRASQDLYLKVGGSDNKEADDAYLTREYQKGNFGIPATYVTSTPTAIKIWWDKHRDLICSVQPRVDWLDKLQLSQCKPWEYKTQPQNLNRRDQ
jgi:hypothetical protein